MSLILDLIEKISDIEEGIRKNQELFAEFPESLAIAQNLRSLEKRKESLELRFREVSSKEHLDVFEYRMISEIGYSALSVGNTLTTFQRWFAVVFDALKNGPKRRARLSPETTLQAELSFGYSFSGSLGLTFTIPSERTLFENDLQLAIAKAFEMARSNSSDQIAYFSRELGPAVIRALKDWAQSQIDGGFAVTARWFRGDEVTHSFECSQSQLRELALAISETSDELEEEIIVRGDLVGADTVNKKFHFNPLEGPDIRGSMSDTIGGRMVLELPRRYEAIIRTLTFINYATDEETVRYHLVDLKKV